jgi:hypothetical protein
MLEVDDGVLRVKDEAAVRSEAGVEAAVQFEPRDEATACSGAEIEDGKRRQRNGV